MRLRCKKLNDVGVTLCSHVLRKFTHTHNTQTHKEIHENDGNIHTHIYMQSMR